MVGFAAARAANLMRHGSISDKSAEAERIE